MRKSYLHTFIAVLCLVAICVAIAGCGGQAATKEKKECTKEKQEKSTAKKAVKKLGPYEFTKNWMDEEGFITNWLVVGPFPNPGERPDNTGYDTDYLKDVGGEAAYKPADGMEIKKPDGTAVKWQQHKSPYPEISFFAIEHLGLEYDQEDILCYSACWLESDAEKDVEIRVGSDDGYKLWVNHKPTGAEHVYRAMEIDQEVYPVKLSKGMNLVLIKVDQDWGEYEFVMRVVTPDGKEVSGVKIWN